MLAVIFGIGVFFIVLGQLHWRGASAVFPKALVAGVIGWVVALLLFSIGKAVIIIALAALGIIVVALLIQKFVGRGVT